MEARDVRESNGNKRHGKSLRRKKEEKGSCGKVRSQIIRASDVGFIDSEIAMKLYNDCVELSKAIAAFIKSTRSSDFSGKKYLDPES